MPTPAALKTQMPELGRLQMRAEGFAAWIAWSGEVNPVLVQTLEDYGGVLVAEERDSSLWFFFSIDAVLASARLAVWSRFNRLAVTIQIFSAGIQVDVDGKVALTVEDAFWSRQISTPSDFLVWIHTAVHEAVAEIPGISLSPAKEKLPTGMAAETWLLLAADSRLPYQASLGWYVLLRPVGDPLDKAFQVGWREFFAQTEAILQRNKLRFTIYDSFLMFPLDSLRHCRHWCNDYLELVNRLKKEHPEQYWPCVSVVVDRKGLNFNQDLPKKIPLQWDRLPPDFPLLSMRNALLLGKEFLFHETRIAPVGQSPDDWVGVSLRDEESGGSLPQFVPEKLVSGSFPYCFYCGQRSHVTRDCPSRNFPAHSTKVWNQTAQLTFTAMHEAVQEIDAKLSAVAEHRNDVIARLALEGTPAGVLTNAFFDIDWVVQPRAVNLFWRSRSKDIQRVAADLMPMDEHPIWAALDTFPRANPEDMEKELQNLATRYPKDFRVMSLRGFAAMERGDLLKARTYWKDAELYSGFPVVQAWHVFLQARLQEFQGEYMQAAILYDQVSRTITSWWDAKYRYMVCLVKNGFSQSMGPYLLELVDKSGHYFNKALLDPELERGYMQISSQLFNLWTTMEARSKSEAVRLRSLRDELSSWFMPDQPFAGQLDEKIRKLMQLTDVSNYVAFQMLSTGRKQLEKELQAYVAQEGRELKAKFKGFTERLQVIHDEAAWFPFRRALRDFNKMYNAAAANMNWAARTGLHVPEAFKKAQMLAVQEEERLKKMEARMRFLRIIRDSTLFLLSVGESFFWVELCGVILIFIVLPLILVYGGRIGLDIPSSIFVKDRWDVQKALFIIVSVLSLVVAAMRTILRFEVIRDKIMAKARAAAPAVKKQSKK